MTALTADRNTPARSGDRVELTVYGVAATTIYAGSLVCVTSAGLAVPGGHAQAVRAIGRAEETVVNPLGGALTVTVRRGVFQFAADAQLFSGSIGGLAYVVDDQTVGGYDTGRIPAGRIVEFDSAGAWVAVGETPLSGVAFLSKTYVPIHVATLVGTGAYRAVAPVAGTITKIWSVIEGVLTTGNATLTAAIGATPITGGVITITQAGSAPGDIDSATPTAANIVDAGDGISVTVGGTNATATVARVLVEITGDFYDD